jgi:hypothetical protein
MGEITNASTMYWKNTFQGKEGIWTLSVITLACNLPKGKVNTTIKTTNKELL